MGAFKTPQSACTCWVFTSLRALFNTVMLVYTLMSFFMCDGFHSLEIILKGQKPELKTKQRDSELTRRFSGLMSLCTMLRPCRYLRALARLYTMALPSLSVYLVEEVIASKRSPPYRTAKEM